MEYRVIYAQELDDLDWQLRDYAEDGFTPIGGVACMTRTDWAGCDEHAFWVQVVVRKPKSVIALPSRPWWRR